MRLLISVALKVFLVVAFVIQSTTYAQNTLDSLKTILSNSAGKAEPYNLLSEASRMDSLELSFEFAQKAFKASIEENNLQQKGLAYFNIAEVFTYQYQADSAKFYYNQALDLFKQTEDKYNISYALNNLGWLANSYGEYDDAINYYLKSLDYIDKQLCADDLSHIYVNIGNAYYQTGKYETSIKYFKQAIKISHNIDYKPILTYAYNGIGLSFKYLSVFDSAIYYYKTTLEIDKENQNDLGLAIDYHNIGSLYYEWKQYDLALDYFNASRDIYHKIGSPNDKSLILNNIGNVYKKKKEYTIALDYFEKALSIDRTTGIEINIAARYNNIGELYAEKGQYQKALEYYQKSIRLNREKGHSHNIAINLHNMGDAYARSKNYTLARKYYSEGLLIADSINAATTIITFLESLAILNEKGGNYKKALDYHIRLTKLKDSIFKEKSQMALADMKTKFDVDLKDQEIALLNNKNKYQKLEVNTYRAKLIFLGIGIVLISFLSFFLIAQYLNKNRAYKKLVERNKEYLEHEKQIKLILTNPKNQKDTNQDKKLKNGESNHQQLMQKLLLHFEENKPYLNQEITLKEMADLLNTNPKYLSQAINTNFNKNFNTFVNEYRVKLAMKYLANGVKEKYSIEGISAKVGFHSKSAFNLAFKKMTGVTPSYYIKSLKKRGPELMESLP